MGILILDILYAHIRTQIDIVKDAKRVERDMMAA